jgi:hypothetical protein
VPETGANVTFTIRITASQENARLVSFSDSVFNVNTRCPDWPSYFINAGQSYTCTFVAFISGDYPGNHQNIATATIKDNENKTDLDVTAATVSFTDVMPNISVNVTANPASLVEPGGNVSFAVQVTNDSSEAAKLNSLVDTKYGNLNGQGNCVANGSKTINPSGGTYNCSFTKSITGGAGTNQVNTTTATVSDNDGNSKSAADNATVTITPIFYNYLPVAFKDLIAPAELSVFNNNTGGTVTFKVIDVNVSCTIPNNTTKFCGSFEPGTYTIQVVTSTCGSLTTHFTFVSGPQTRTVVCK